MPHEVAVQRGVLATVVAGALLTGVWGGTEVGAQHLVTRTLVDTRFAGATIVLTLQGRSTRSSVSPVAGRHVTFGPGASA